MIRRSSRIVLEVLGSLLAGFALLVAALAWRLSQEEPLRLRFLTPYLEEGLAAPDGSFEVRIGDTVLTWAGWERTLDLRARDVRAIVDGGEVAAVPQVGVSLSMRALLRGRVAPTAIELFGPTVTLVRDRNGELHLLRALEEGAAGRTGEPSAVLPAILAELSKPPDRSKPTGYLDEVRILDGSAVFDDRRAGIVWQAPEATIEMRRTPGGISASLALAVDNLGTPARLAADLDYDRQSGRIAVTGRFADVQLAALGLVEVALSDLASSDLALSGALRSSIDLLGNLGETRFSAFSDGGFLALPDSLPEPLPVRRFSVRGVLRAGLNEALLDEAVLQTDGPTLRLTGTAEGLSLAGDPPAGGLSLKGRISVDRLEVDALARYWPLDAARGARAWATANLSDGIAEEGAAVFALTVPPGADEDVVIEQVEGHFRASGLTLRYFGPLPPIRNAAGEARFTHEGFAADFSGGNVGALAIESGRLRITEFEQRDQPIDIQGVVAGPLREALLLLDHERLGYARKLGIEAAAAEGTMRTELGIRFLAVKDVVFDEVAIEARSSLADVALEGGPFGSVSDGDLELALDRRGMTVGGTARLRGIPAALEWQENFEGGDFLSRIAIEASPTAEQRAALGYDFRPWLDGPLPLDLTYTRRRDSRAVVEASLDLEAAILGLPFLGWEKPAGRSGLATFTLELDGERPTAIPRFAVEAADLAATGSGRFTADGAGLDSVALSRLRVGLTDLREVTASLSGPYPEIAIGGGQLDAEPLLADEEDEPEGEEDESQQAFSLRADRLDRVLLSPERALENVQLALRHDGAFWEEIQIDSVLEGGSPLTVRYLPDPATATHRLSVETADAGAALRTFDIIDTVVGGRLTIVGEAKDAEPERPLRGQAEIREFRLVRAPVLARLLSVATLTGLVDMLTGEGFLFTRFTGSFTKTGGLLEVPLARAYGPSLGLTTTGKVDFDTDTVDLQGTIVPAYAFNSILGNIPVIGDLLQGGKGRGIFAATYRATGPLEEPNIFVNPLAALAPGFLRGLFDVFDPSGAPSEAAALPPPTGGNR